MDSPFTRYAAFLMITYFDFTRIGVNYDKELMQNIKDMFRSMKILKLDAIGFVAKAVDARLTA
jgi:hypothetical protein